MNHVVRKPAFCICEKQRLRSPSSRCLETALSIKCASSSAPKSTGQALISKAPGGGGHFNTLKFMKLAKGWFLAYIFTFFFLELFFYHTWTWWPFSWFNKFTLGFGGYLSTEFHSDAISLRINITQRKFKKDISKGFHDMASIGCGLSVGLVLIWVRSRAFKSEWQKS